MTDPAYCWNVSSRGPVSLDEYDPGYTAGMDKKSAAARQLALRDELQALQEALFAAAHNSVLIVLQGSDTSGKGGTIEHVMSGVNPQGCHVVAFKEPTPLELAHDFLWRIHAQAPARGAIAIFDRSHYEDVVVVRVHDLVPEAQWRRNYAHIRAFERLLSDSGTIILKFFLHISRDEQAERLRDREQEVDKRWKLAVGDYTKRLRWDDYQRAYADMIGECATPEAPWYIVPADHKWFRNLAVAHTIVEALRPHAPVWQERLRTRGERNYQALLEARRSGVIR